MPYNNSRNRNSQNNNQNRPDASANRRPFFKRNTSCPFEGKDAPRIDYKNIKLLYRYISDKGKITPARISNVSPKNQRKLEQAIKRARFLALIPS